MPNSAHIAATLALHSQGLPLRFVQAVQAMVTVQNPEREQMARAGVSASHLPALLPLWEQRADWLHVPRGAVKMVRQQAALHGAELQWTSSVVSRAFRRVPIENLPVNLRPYQREAVEAMLFGVQGQHQTL